MDRLTPQQKDAKYGPVFNLTVKARETHKALTKAKHDGSAEEKVQEHVTAVRQADKVVAEAVANYTMDDVRLLLAYVPNAAIQIALTPDGKGGMRWDAQVSRSLVHALQSLPDSVAGCAELKVLAYRRMRSAEMFIQLFETLSLVPRYGINDKSVRFGLSILLKKIEEAKASGNMAQVTLLNQLYTEVTRAFPKSWLEEREEQRPQAQARPQTAAATIGEQVGAQAVAAAEAATVPEGKPRKQTRKTR